MALVVYDRVQETTATTGTGTLTLGGAVAGYQSFAVVGNGNTTFYCITNGSAWEVGIGTYTSSGTTLARTTVLSNSNGNTSPITLSGASNVFITYPASKSINYDENNVATIGSTLSYSDTGIIASFASTVAGYNQVIVQNKSSATNASANLNISNDASTSTTGFVELGVNSSTFTGTGSFSIAGASYLASASTDLVIGTYGAYNLRFVTNSNTTDAMTIFNDGGMSLGGLGNPGIGNVAVNNAIVGLTSITSAGGITTLTAASTQVQIVTGTLNQTIRLPQATTLLRGTFYTLANASTGILTVQDNAGTTIETITTGGAAQALCTSNATSAGSWGFRVFAASNVTWGNAALDYSGAITSAVWNGTTIASGYGGTGLTTFTAANNALYSTSASALAAGTLPIAAGGTAATTFTANGVLYGNGTSALGVTAAGTTGQVLIGNTGAAPSWGTVSSSLVSSFSAGTTGFTPSSATTGAVTLSGTLNVANGGTGQTTASTAFNGLSPITTLGDIIYGSATNTSSRLAGNTTSTKNFLVQTGTGTVSAAPSWGTIAAADVPTLNQNTTGSAGSVANTLTIGTGLSGTSYNGSAAVTIANSGVTSIAAGTGISVSASTGAVTITNSVTNPIPTGTVMLFYQSAAPTGWTQVTTAGLDDSALRIVTSTGGTTGGTTAFSTVFTNQTPSGTVSTTNTATTATMVSYTPAGSISVTVGAGTLAVGAGTFAVAATTLATSQIPSHQHLGGASFQFANGPYGTAASGSNSNQSGQSGQNDNHNYTSNVGGGGSHTHTLSGSPSISGSPSVTAQSFTGTAATLTQNSHNHTASSSFTGSALTLNVKYVNIIICSKN